MKLTTNERLGSIAAVLLLTWTAACAPRVADQAASPEPCASRAAPAASSAEAERVNVLRVAAAETDCVGVGPQTCLRVREDGAPEFQDFFSTIEGFEYVPGFEYVLKVNVTERKDVPADASSLRYELVEVVEKVPAGLALQSAWIPRDAQADSGMLLEFEDEALVGSGGVNRFRAVLAVDGTQLDIGPIAVTRRAGPPDFMAKEHAFLDRLQKVTRYRIVGEELRLLDAHRRVVLVLRQAEPS